MVNDSIAYHCTLTTTPAHSIPHPIYQHLHTPHSAPYVLLDPHNVIRTFQLTLRAPILVVSYRAFLTSLTPLIFCWSVVDEGELTDVTILKSVITIRFAFQTLSRTFCQCHTHSIIVKQLI